MNGTREKKTFLQAAKYLAVGGSSAALELAIFQLLSAGAGMAPGCANVIAVVASTVFNFLANKNVTFKSTANPLRSFMLYIVLFAFNATFSTACISLLAQHGVYPLLAKVATMACIVLWNFVLYKRVVFK